MNKNQALNLLVQIVEQYKGTAEEHRLLAQAVSTIATLIKDKVKDKVKTDDKKE